LSKLTDKSENYGAKLSQKLNRSSNRQ